MAGKCRFSAERAGIAKAARSHGRGAPKMVEPREKWDGGQGWIRTSVRFHGQIYSLLPLTTRPPLQVGWRGQWPPAEALSTGPCLRALTIAGSPVAFAPALHTKAVPRTDLVWSG